MAAVSACGAVVAKPPVAAAPTIVPIAPASATEAASKAARLWRGLMEKRGSTGGAIAELASVIDSAAGIVSEAGSMRGSGFSAGSAGEIEGDSTMGNSILATSLLAVSPLAASE